MPGLCRDPFSAPLSKAALVSLGYEEVALDDFWQTFVQELDNLPSMEMGQLEVCVGCLHLVRRLGVGGGGVRFCCSAIGHASLLRRSAVFTPDGDASNNLGAQCASFIYNIKQHCFFILFVSSLVVCDRHLSPRTAIVLSSLCNVSNFSMLRRSIVLVSSTNTFHFSLCSSRFPTMWVLTSSVLP